VETGSDQQVISDLCNVPDAVMEQFQANRLAKHLNIYPDLEEALKPDA
jgi:hypothetical protein